MARQSLIPIFQALTARIESLTPTIYPDVGFTSPRGNLGAGDAEDWITEYKRLTRDFVVYVAEMPSLTPGSSPCHVSQSVNVSVVYRATLADDIRDIMMAEDVTTIISGIISRPDLWGGADSVWPRDGAVSVNEAVDRQGATQCYIVTMLFDIVTH